MKKRVKLWVWLLAIVIVIVAGVVVFGPVLFASVAYPLPDKYRGALAKYGQQYGVDPNLVAGLIQVESHWRENARSYAGAIGLLQFMPTTAMAVAKRLGVSPFSPQDLVSNPELAIQFGSYYISEAIKRYNGNVKLALIAYNGGGGAASAYLAGSPVRGTVGYARKVTATWQAYIAVYKEWYKNPSTPPTSDSYPEFKIEPKRDLNLLKTIPIVLFWQNVIVTKPDEAPATIDIENFWQNIILENP